MSSDAYGKLTIRVKKPSDLSRAGGRHGHRVGHHGRPVVPERGGERAGERGDEGGRAGAGQ